MSEQSEPAEQAPKLTRRELLDKVAVYEETGKNKNMPHVPSSDLLVTGDLVELVSGNADAPHIKQMLVLEVNKRPDETGQEKTYISGLESSVKDFSQYVNNPEKIKEYAALTGDSLNGLDDVAQAVGSMAASPAVQDPSLPSVEYEAGEIGLLPPTGDRHPFDATAVFLAKPAQAPTPEQVT